jgi:hypothetical protein
MGYVVRAKRCAFAVSHELQGLFQDLGEAVVDVAGQLFDYVVRQ